jgi:hypothetical protein
MVTQLGKKKHWCPHHCLWTKHPPDACRIQPVLDGDQGVALNGVQRENFLRVEPAWGSINLININLILITTMAEIIKNLIIRNLLYWLPGDPCEGQTHVLDFNRKVDLDVYYEGRTPVLEGDNCFDLKPETLGQFLKLLDRKATDQGWNDASSTQQIGIFNITQDDSFYSRITISITKEHNFIEMTALRA